MPAVKVKSYGRVLTSAENLKILDEKVEKKQKEEALKAERKKQKEEKHKLKEKQRLKEANKTAKKPCNKKTVSSGMLNTYMPHKAIY